MGSLSWAKLKSAGIGVFFHPRDLERLHLTFSDLERLVERGVVEQVGRGLYRLASVEADEFETIAMIGSAVPGAIVCLLSALVLHDIGTQLPHEVWIGLDRKARKPSRPPSQVRVVRFSGPTLTYGIQTRTILGVPVRVTSPARTVVDCFRYRRKIGLNVAIEALREAVRSRKTTVSELVRAADVCRARTVISPYLEMLSA